MDMFLLFQLIFKKHTENVKKNVIYIGLTHGKALDLRNILLLKKVLQIMSFITICRPVKFFFIKPGVGSVLFFFCFQSS